MSMAVRMWRQPTEVTMKRTTVLMILLSLMCLARSSGAEIAFLKGGHIFVAEADGKNARQVDGDPRPKGHLTWDSSRKYFSYLVRPFNDEIARGVVVDSTGKKVSEFSIRPANRIGGSLLFRFVDEVTWTSDGKLRVWGSVNPSNCEMFDLDIMTGGESNEQFWKCDTFFLSPDGKHTAALRPVAHFSSEPRYDGVSLDNNDAFTAYNSKRMFLPAGPVWSPDSKQLAVLEQDGLTGEAAVTILLLDGTYTRIPIPVSILEHPAIAWVGTRVVAGEGSDSVQIDSVTKRLGPMTFDVADDITRVGTEQRQREAAKEHVDAVVKKLGGQGSILLQ
jgi:hypothetical protein